MTPHAPTSTTASPSPVRQPRGTAARTAGASAAGVLAACLALAGLGGCSADSALSGSADEPTLGGGGGAAPGGPPDGPFDVGAPGPVDVPETDAASVGPDDKPSKDVPGLLVPPLEAPRGGLTLSTTHAAWIRRAPSGQPTALVGWRLDDASAPSVLVTAQLSGARDLTLGADWLAWVDDDPEGDTRVRAVNLVSGDVVTVADGPGAQAAPAFDGTRLAYTDCAACAEGGVAVLVVAELDADGGLEQVELTPSDASADARTPTWDGAAAAAGGRLVWLEGSTTGRVLDAPLGTSDAIADAAVVTWPSPPLSVAAANGRLAVRSAPMIINPDSMIPTDVWLLAPGGADPTPLTYGINPTGAPLPPVVGASPPGGPGRFAWATRSGLEGPATLWVVGASPEAPVLAETPVDGLSEVAMAPGWVGWIAPRQDNGGAPDVHLAPVP